MKKRLGFTLIELLAVLVVLAILALISVPITIRIINNARENSYKRSIENYAKTFEKVIAIDSMSNASSDYKTLTSYAHDVENMYAGNKVSCDLENSTIDNGKLRLVGCMVVKEITSYNPSNRLSKKTYTYYDGSLSEDVIYDYHIGDTFTLHNDLYYIIKNSPEDDDYVVALKDTPLKASEITAAGGTVGTTYSDENQTGGMRYHGSLSAYAASAVKGVVDSWATSKFTDELKQVDGYRARLITKDELVTKLGCTSNSCANSRYSWTYNSIYWYWTMTSYNPACVWDVGSGGGLNGIYVYYGDFYGAVRPVINVYKSAISS